MYMGDRRIMIPLIGLYIPCAISSVVVVSVSVWSVPSELYRCSLHEAVVDRAPVFYIVLANPTPGIIACAVVSLPTHLYAFWCA